MADTPDVNQMYNEAVALKDEGDLDGAVARLRAILQIDADHILSHSALAVYLHKQGRLEEAVAHAERVTQLAPDDPFSYTQLSVINQRCGRIQEAEDAMAYARQLQMGQ
ncbi:MAG: tetratricopeptide repeat protein [Planctomycetaceae bacterium]